MATKNIVPNANGEGSIGTAAKGWGGAFLTSAATSSTSAGAKLQLISNDGAVMADTHQLGIIEFLGAEDGSGTISLGASIEAVADETFTASENASALVFKTTSGTTVSEVLRLDKDKLATFAGDATFGGGDVKISKSSTPTLQLTQTGGTEYNAYIKLGGNDLEIRGSSGIMEFYNGGNNDGNSATLALSISSSQNATFAGNIAIPDSGTIGCASDTDLLTLANQSLTVAGALTVSGAGNSAFSGPLFISHSSGDSLTLTKDTTEPSLRLEGDSNKDFVITVNGELLTFTQNDGATDILTLDHDTKNATFGGNIAIPRTFNDTNNAVIYIDSTINSGASTYQGSLLLQAGGAGSASYGSGLRLYGHAHASSPGSVEVGLSAVSGAKFTIDTYGAGGGTDLVTVERDNGNVTVSTGNLIIGTAGKGVDFSAETPSESGAGAVSSSI